MSNLIVDPEPIILEFIGLKTESIEPGDWNPLMAAATKVYELRNKNKVGKVGWGWTENVLNNKILTALKFPDWSKLLGALSEWIKHYNKNIKNKFHE